MSEFQKMRTMISRMHVQTGRYGRLRGFGGRGNGHGHGPCRWRRGESQCEGKKKKGGGGGGGWVSVQGEKSLEYFTICQEAGTKINIPMITYRFVQKDYE